MVFLLDHGIVGNCITCALIGKRGGVEWFCFPDFDSPSIFARLLDRENGGSFSFVPDRPCKVKQEYMENTNILETTFSCRKYAFRIIDFFPRYKKIVPRGRKQKLVKENHLIRIVERIRGNPGIRVRFNPRLNYARGETEIFIEGKKITAKQGNHEIDMVTNADTDSIARYEKIQLNQRLFFVLGRVEDPDRYTTRRCRYLLSWTGKYWRNWVRTLILPSEKREMIIRSALVLKLLTYSRTGAIIAAPTTSIPEDLGSGRCFDYRYCWLRDAAYTVDALYKIGRNYEAKKLMEFIIEKAISDDHIQIMYGIRGETRLREHTLDHLEGFRGSGPVRIGNAAYNQDQHDIYGEMIDIMYLYYAYYEFEKKMTRKYWRFLRWLVNQIKFKWERRDSGIWEFRDAYRHFTYSKFMCYIGMDRAIKLAQHFRRDDLAEEWTPTREEIKNDILQNGYNGDAGSFTMFYGSRDLDASLLRMTYHEFLDSSDQYLINTVKSIYDDLRRGYLVRRYNVRDDFGASGSSFAICSFWLADSLWYIGEKERARSIYEKIIKHSNHLGLFSEDINMKTKKQLGNFPQAYTHIALINTSILLSEWSAKRKKIDWGSIKRRDWF